MIQATVNSFKDLLLDSPSTFSEDVENDNEEPNNKLSLSNTETVPGAEHFVLRLLGNQALRFRFVKSGVGRRKLALAALLEAATRPDPNR